MSKKKRGDQGAAEPAGPPPNNPFAALAGLRSELPEGEPPEASGDPDEPASPPVPQRAVVRYQRKGRGGKEVTLIEKLDLPADELARWCRELKQALGCGGTVEGESLALAGDQRARLPALLEQRGVTRVSVS